MRHAPVRPSTVGEAHRTVFFGLVAGGLYEDLRQMIELLSFVRVGVV